MDFNRNFVQDQRAEGEINNSHIRAAKAKAQEEYAEASKESIKKYKLIYIDNLTEKAEQAAGCGNMKQLEDITRKLSGK